MRGFSPPGSPPISLFRLEHAVVIGAPGVFGTQRSGKTILFAESIPYPGQMATYARERLAAAGPPPEKMDVVPSACLLDSLWATNFWHWFAEFIPRAIALVEAGFDGTFLVPSEAAAFADSLEHLGCPRERIRPHKSNYLSVRSLFFTEAFNGHHLGRWPWLLDRVWQWAQTTISTDAGPERLYIGRRGVKRCVLNEPEVIARLEQQGFVVVYMEDHPIQWQIAFFTSETYGCCRPEQYTQRSISYSRRWAGDL